MYLQLVADILLLGGAVKPYLRAGKLVENLLHIGVVIRALLQQRAGPSPMLGEFDENRPPGGIGAADNSAVVAVGLESARRLQGGQPESEQK